MPRPPTAPAPASPSTIRPPSRPPNPHLETNVDAFGEIALLRDLPRTATVTARTDGLLHALDRETFQLVVGGHRFCCRTAQSMADERLERVPVAGTAGT